MRVAQALKDIANIEILEVWLASCYGMRGMWCWCGAQRAVWITDTSLNGVDTAGTGPPVHRQRLVQRPAKIGGPRSGAA